MKGKEEVIQDFNDVVNMTSSELEKWLKSSDPESAGWSKDDGSGESVGHDSGRKIIEILKDNPDKKPDEYTDEHIEHMRKVVAYCKRHLAQESAGNAKKSPEELKKTKSYASLKNWGHDILKAQNGSNGSNGSNGNKKDSDEAEAGEKRTRQDDDAGGKKVNKTSKNSSVKDEKKKDEDEDEEAEDDDYEEEEVEEEAEEEKDEEAGDGEEKASTKRQTRSGQNGEKQSNGKKQQNGTEPQNGKKQQNGKKGQNGSKKEEKNEDDENDEPSDDKKKSSGGSKDGEPKPGEKVSWNWGGGQPEGKVLDVKHEKTSITTKNGNEVSRDGSGDDPAVVLDTGKSKAIKAAHELN